LQFLRKISTSKQLFVQRLDEEDGDDEEVEEELNLQRDLELDVNSNCPVTEAIYEELQLSECNQALDLATSKEVEVEELQPAAKHDLRTKYMMSCGNYEVLDTPLTTIEFERVKYKANVRYHRHTNRYNQGAGLTFWPFGAPQPRHLTGYSRAVGSGTPSRGGGSGL